MYLWVDWLRMVPRGVKTLNFTGMAHSRIGLLFQFRSRQTASHLNVELHQVAVNFLLQSALNL